jgi:aminoglycoside phosphotransferase (APT) family kinase protein
MEEAAATLEAARLLRAALGSEPRALTRQTLTESGNLVFRADLANGETVALRMSARAGSFAWTGHNLAALRQLGLPVPACRAHGVTPTGSYVVLDWLPGEDLARALPALDDDRLAGIAGTVRELQRRVAGLPPSRGYGWAPVGRDAAGSRWSDLFGAPVSETSTPVVGTPAAGPAEDPLLGRLRAARRSLETYFSRVRPICFLDDLTTRNLLIANAEVSGVIDVDFVCYGDPLLSVGTTLGNLASEAPGSGYGIHYGSALLQAWNPTGDALRAVWFYASLWALARLRSAESAGGPRAGALRAEVERMLERALGRPGGRVSGLLPLSRCGSG